MKLIYILLRLGCGLKLLKTDSFHISQRDAKSMKIIYEIASLVK